MRKHAKGFFFLGVSCTFVTSISCYLRHIRGVSISNTNKHKETSFDCTWNENDMRTTNYDWEDRGILVWITSATAFITRCKITNLDWFSIRLLVYICITWPSWLLLLPNSCHSYMIFKKKFRGQVIAKYTVTPKKDAINHPCQERWGVKECKKEWIKIRTCQMTIKSQYYWFPVSLYSLRKHHWF